MGYQFFIYIHVFYAKIVINFQFLINIKLISEKSLVFSRIVLKIFQKLFYL